MFAPWSVAQGLVLPLSRASSPCLPTWGSSQEYKVGKGVYKVGPGGPGEFEELHKKTKVKALVMR